MPRISFDELPQDSRLWIFPAERALSPQEEAQLLSKVDSFLEEWAAHGTPLTGARDWRYGRFLLVAVDEASVPPSGCSIDAMTGVLKQAGEALGLSFVDQGPVFFKKGEEVHRASRAEFKAKAEVGEVALETTVFDNSITHLGQLASGEWEKPAGASWHRRAFFPNE